MGWSDWRSLRASRPFSPPTAPSITSPGIFRDCRCRRSKLSAFSSRPSANPVHVVILSGAGVPSAPLLARWGGGARTPRSESLVESKDSCILPSRLQAGANRAQQLLVVGRFLEEGNGAQFEGPFFIGLGIARRKHNHRDARERRKLLQVL